MHHLPGLHGAGVDIVYHWRSLFGIPVTQTKPPPCKAEKSQIERELAENGGMEFVGAARRFLLLSWPDGANGGTSFSVFDAATARKLYTDAAKVGTEGLSLTRFGSSDNNTLELHYGVARGAVFISKWRSGVLEPVCA